MGFLMCVLALPLIHFICPRSLELRRHLETNRRKQPIKLKCNINREEKQFLTWIFWETVHILVASEGKGTNKEVIWLSFHLNYCRDLSGPGE